MTDVERPEEEYDSAEFRSSGVAGGAEGAERTEKMTNGRAPVLIISKKGSLRDGLAALLDAIPHVGVVDTADSLDEALRTSEPERTPVLIVLDARAAGADIWLAVRRAKARWREGRCIVLADNFDQHGEAEAAGADAVLINGFPAAKLDATLVRLLPHTDDEEDVPVCVCDHGRYRTKSQRPSPGRPAVARVQSADADTDGRAGSARSGDDGSQ